ncbi:MAG: YitT family protein [Acetatifactor sp.]
MEMTKEQQNEIRYEEKKTPRRRFLDYMMITVAAVLYAVAISLFLDPNSLVPGGVTGVSIILNRITGLETGTLVLVMNLPILLIGMWKFGLKFILSTIYCTAVTSFFINLLAPYGPVTTDMFLAALAGGAMMTLGIGIAFKAGATTGGMDIVVKLLRLKFPHCKTGFLFLLTDAAVVTASALVFRNVDVALYAGLVVVINSTLLDVVLYGRDGAKMIYIISDRPEAITARLLEELDIGVTYISGVGAYSGKEKLVIFCVMKKQLSPKAEEIVRQEDPGAFMIVTGANEIFGEGYKSIFSEKL